MLSKQVMECNEVCDDLGRQLTRQTLIHRKLLIWSKMSNEISVLAVQLYELLRRR